MRSARRFVRSAVLAMIVSAAALLAGVGTASTATAADHAAAPQISSVMDTGWN